MWKICLTLLALLAAGCGDDVARRPRKAIPELGPAGGAAISPDDAASGSGSVTTKVSVRPKPAPKLAITVQQSERVLFDFEVPADVAQWKPNYISRVPFLMRSAQFASKGIGSMGFDLDAGQQYPGILLRAQLPGYFDWSDAERFLFEIFNAQDTPQTLNLRIDGPPVSTKPKQRPTGIIQFGTNFTVKPGLNYLQFPLKSMDTSAGRVDPGHITQVILFAIQPPSTLRFYMDNFRLGLSTTIEKPVSTSEPNTKRTPAST